MLTRHKYDSLAHSEMRQIIARLIWKYDFELVDHKWLDVPWHDQPVQASYVKPPLNVKFSFRPGR